jgi:hypothetical protein
MKAKHSLADCGISFCVCAAVHCVCLKKKHGVSCTRKFTFVDTKVEWHSQQASWLPDYCSDAASAIEFYIIILKHFFLFFF